MIKRFLADETHEGWGLARKLWALAMACTWLQRGVHFEERYTDAGAVVVRSYIPVNDLFYFSPMGGWTVYLALLTAIVLVYFGRATRAVLVVAIVCHLALNLTEGLNFKGYDRLFFWQGICLLAAPGRVEGRRAGLPIARYCVLITYFGLYGQTGWEKIANEPTWWEGLPLMYNMVHRNFGDMPLGVMLSDLTSVMVLMSWTTLVFEAGFPFLWWFKRVRPWLLLTGVGFHIGILVLMNVPNFTTASLALYPLLLTPDEYTAWRERLRLGLTRLSARFSPEDTAAS